MDFLTASLASMNANLFTHPLETIKVRQMMHGGSTISVGLDIVKNEGFRALYKGLNAALIRAVISGGGRLYGYSFLKQTANQYGFLHDDPTPSEMSLLAVFAISSACFAQYLAVPIDLVRTRQAANKGQTRSIVHVTKEVIQTDGLRGMLSGSTALMFRAATFNLGQLLTYDKSKAKTIEFSGYEASDIRVHLVASLCAGFMATTFSCPAENVKTYQQLHGKTTILNSMRALWQVDGVKAFYRGWTPLYLKIAPHTMIVFVTMEGLNKVLL